MRHQTLRRRYGRGQARHGTVYSVAGDGLRLASFKTKKKAIEHTQYLEGRGYKPYVYEFIEDRPERHRRIVYGPGIGTVAPPYTQGLP